MAKLFDDRWLMAGIAKEMRRRAFTGKLDYNASSQNYIQDYGDRCTGIHKPTGTIIKFTRDTGHHTCGWWKNPDYESCFHLSLSFRDLETGDYAPHNHKLAKEWVQEFYGDNKRLIWIEPPYSKEGKQADVYHYRLFVHADWQTPLLPRGEVYSRECTEAGWKSWSDVQAEIQERQQRVLEAIADG